MAQPDRNASMQMLLEAEDLLIEGLNLANLVGMAATSAEQSDPKALRAGIAAVTDRLGAALMSLRDARGAPARQPGADQ